MDRPEGPCDATGEARANGRARRWEDPARPQGGPHRRPKPAPSWIRCPGSCDDPARFLRRSLGALTVLVGVLSLCLVAIGAAPYLASNRVVRVIDGDTVVLNRGGALVTCRLIGLDAPESTTKHEPYGPEATAYLRGWIEGKVIRVDYERRDARGNPVRDRYGRLLVYLFADYGRQLVNLEMIERGMGQYYRGYPTRYKAEMIAAEARARANHLGLWAITPQ